MNYIQTERLKAELQSTDISFLLKFLSSKLPQRLVYHATLVEVLTVCYEYQNLPLLSQVFNYTKTQTIEQLANYTIGMNTSITKVYSEIGIILKQKVVPVIAPLSDYMFYD